MKLLIVDDSALIRRAITSAYQGTVFTEIQTASDGLLAVTIFKKFLPDVVTLDITMPHMDGLAALSQIVEIHPQTNVLVISALADHHTAIEALTRGADQFICKPFTPEELREALNDLIKSSNINQQPTKTQHPEQTHSIDSFEQFQKKTRSNQTPPVTVLNNVTTPSQEDYPSGFVKPPCVKKPISLSNYADEMTSLKKAK